MRALPPPPKKNTQRRTKVPTLPPLMRSRAALGLTAAASRSELRLQQCDDCGSVLYPPRDACSSCLSVDLSWQAVSALGTLLAQTNVHISTNTYFRERAPLRVATVRMDAGPSIICHVHADCEAGARVQMINRLDKAGQGVLMALPQKVTPNMDDDPQLRELTAHPKHRRILISDGRAGVVPFLVEALQEAGAGMIFVGLPEDWRPEPNGQALRDRQGVTLLPMDVTDTSSIRRMAGEIGGKVDILINTARFVRPGGILDRRDTVFSSDEMEVNAMGMMRLAQSFGPAMMMRGADGDGSAVAFVNLLSIHAIANDPAFGSFNASQAAALSISQSLRAEMRSGGIRVMNVYAGPTDDEWHQPLPSPKVAPQALARSIVQGLVDGSEDVFCGDFAKDIFERWCRDAKVLEIELGQGTG